MQDAVQSVGSEWQALPRYFGALNRLLAEEPLDLSRLAEAIQEQPGLARRVRRRAPGRRIEEAIVLLGGDRLRAVVWTAALGDHLTRRGRGELWQEWRRRARMCRQLAEINDYAQPERAYLAGLVADLGVLGRVDVTGWRHEREAWGFDHCQMGAWLGRLWQFPAELIEVMERHHTPRWAEADAALVGLVAVADELCGKRARIAG